MFCCSASLDATKKMSWKLGQISKYTGQWETLDLGLSAELQAFAQGSKDSEGIVSDILSKLYNLDFSGTGKHWCHDGQSINLRSEESNETVQVYDVSESSTWDWKDIYSVAKTTGVIEVNKETSTITVREYRFYCSG
eukprot:gene26537-32071_t